MVKQLIGSIQMHTVFLSHLNWSRTFWNAAHVCFVLGEQDRNILVFLFGYDNCADCRGFSLTWGCLGYQQEFMLALSMGQTRREFMITYALRQVLWVIAVYITILHLGMKQSVC